MTGSTGRTLSDIQFLRWEYVKDDCIELPDAKTGGRVVPLEPEARAVLADLPREDGNPWVIRGKVPGTHLTDLQRPWRRIRTRAEQEQPPWTRSVLPSADQAFHVRQEAIGYNSPTVDATATNARILRALTNSRVQGRFPTTMHSSAFPRESR